MGQAFLHGIGGSLPVILKAPADLIPQQLYYNTNVMPSSYTGSTESITKLITFTAKHSGTVELALDATVGPWGGFSYGDRIRIWVNGAIQDFPGFSSFTGTDIRTVDSSITLSVVKGDVIEFGYRLGGGRSGQGSTPGRVRMLDLKAKYAIIINDLPFSI